MESSLISLLPLALAILLGYAVYFAFSRRRARAPELGPAGEQPYGVHGWLRFFVFASYVLAPIFSLGRLSNALHTAEERTPQLLNMTGWGQYKVASWLFLAFMVTWQWWCAYNLNNRLVPKSIFHVKVLLIVAPFVVFVDLFLVQVLLDVRANAEAIGSIIGGFVGACLVSAVWFLYFTRSARVRNTYRTWPVPVRAATAAAQSEPRPTSIDQVSQGGRTIAASERVPVKPAASIDPKSAEARLEALKRMLDRGLITPEDFQRKKNDILGNL